MFDFYLKNFQAYLSVNLKVLCAVTNASVVQQKPKMFPHGVKFWHFGTGEDRALPPSESPPSGSAHPNLESGLLDKAKFVRLTRAASLG